MQTVFESEVPPVSDVDGLFRIRAWVHYVLANPLNDDQLLLAKDMAALLEQIEEADKVIEFCMGNNFKIEKTQEMARRFLAKYPKGDE